MQRHHLHDAHEAIVTDEAAPPRAGRQPHVLHGPERRPAAALDLQLRIFCPGHLDLYHASKLLTATAMLARHGLLRYRFSARNPWQLDELALGMELTCGSQTRKIVIDLRDRSPVFCEGGLDACDIYWKRGFVPADVATLKREWRAKVRPYGLNFTCRNLPSTLAVLAAQIPCHLKHGWQLLCGLRAPVRKRGKHLRKYFAVLPPEQFRQLPQAPAAPVALFQTRLWEPHEVYPDDPAAVNDTRAEMVRVLRRRLGYRFWGGVIPTPYAKQYYPDVLTDLPTHRRQYASLCKQAAIGIYTRGLHYSNAFKLAEYLAASQAIVAEPLVHELPAPLRAGTHLLHFEDAEECAERCAELLADPQRLQAMRQANHEYYLSEVEPAAHLRKCLVRSLQSEPERQRGASVP